MGISGPSYPTGPTPCNEDPDCTPWLPDNWETGVPLLILYAYWILVFVLALLNHASKWGILPQSKNKVEGKYGTFKCSAVNFELSKKTEKNKTEKKGLLKRELASDSRQLDAADDQPEFEVIGYR
eukprot:534935-Pyramimonas_sp.AAC.1